MHPLVTDLVAATEGPCISLFLPALPGLTHAAENIDRLNRALTDIEQRLEPFGITGKAQSQFVASARAYADNVLAAGVSEGTLALFLSPSTFHATLLPVSVSEQSLIGAHFSVTPLLPFLFSSMHYSILALSRNRAHLLDVTNGEVEAVNVPGMPGSLAEAWEGMEHTEESLQSHSAGNGTAMFHGQGNAKDESEMEADAYVQKVAKSLHTIIQERHLPLVFAGVEELYGLYKKHDTTGLLLEDYVKGNPDHLDVEHLLAHADPIIKAAADKRTAAILESYGNVAGTGKTLTDLGDILDAAASGKVDTLLVAEGAEQWGTFDPASSKKELHEASDGTNEELLGLAAMHTLRHRGQVVTVAADQMPEGKQIAAIVRF